MISVEQLTKRYGTLTAVDDVTFRCEPGTVTGFLGPNGAGKSTTMRMICGLTPPSHGRATVAHRPYRELPNPGRHVGVMLDASAQHPGRSGRETLRLSARLLGIADMRVEQLLELVGLSAAEAKRRVRDYSLGMRQRLALAHALLGDPAVLILDEPANGLDPQGIHWMRGLLREFAERGGTVLLSSHLLNEVEALADRLILIARGRIAAQGAKEQLLAASGMHVRALEPRRLERALAAAGISAEPAGDGALHVHADAEAVGRAAAEHHVVLVELRPAGGRGLEQLFLDLTHPGAANGAATPQETTR